MGGGDGERRGKGLVGGVMWEEVNWVLEKTIYYTKCCRVLLYTLGGRITKGRER